MSNCIHSSVKPVMSLNNVKPLRLLYRINPSLRPTHSSSAIASIRNYSSHNWPRKYSPKVFKVLPEIEDAVRSGKPVVALETTIYTHGYPYLNSLKLASDLESVVRLNGGVPATIGILNGVARVGLDPEELIELTMAAGKPDTMKVSRRDLPYITGLGVAGKKITGGTTISGTMILAHMAGIEVFGTGGLGGVHRGGEVSMDVSADLTDLGRTPVAVISSGCKSFLDIPRTLEYLETQGVTVATFADGRTGSIDLPAFWTRDSGVKSPSVVMNEKEAAAIIYARRLLGINSGLFFANPIPAEHSIPKTEIDVAIEEAVRDAEKQGIFGHANTPFILARIKELTKGRSIPANRALIESNVARAARIAVELSKLGLSSESNDLFMPTTHHTVTKRPQPDKASQPTAPTQTQADILVAGSIAVDLSCDYALFDQDSGKPPAAHTSNPAVISQSIGGVGHNVATAAHLASTNSSVRLCSVVADDMPGHMIISSLKGRGLDTSGIKTLATNSENRDSTAQYVAVNDQNKDLVVAMADMRILSSTGADFDKEWLPLIKSTQPKWVIVDANWNTSTIGKWIEGAKSVGAHVAFEPVSVPKSKHLFPPLRKYRSPICGEGIYPSHSIDLATPNAAELVAMHGAAKAHEYFEYHNWWLTINAFGIPRTGARDRFQALVGNKYTDEGVPQMMVQLLPFIPTIITKLGADGVVLATLLSPNSPHLTSPHHAPYILSRDTADSVGGVYMRHFPAAADVHINDIVSVNGVGDTFLGVLVAGLAQGIEVLDERLIGLAQRAAVLTLGRSDAVAPEVASLSAELDGLK